MNDTLIYLFSVVMSLSVQSPNEAGNPADFEIAAGYEWEYTGQAVDHGAELWAWRERESGSRYYGIDSKGRMRPFWPWLEIDGSYVDRTAQDILRGSVGLSGVLWYVVRLGVCNTWDHGDYAFAGHIGYRTEHIQAGLYLYREGLESGYANLKMDVVLNPWLKLVPSTSYTIDRQKNQAYSVKLSLIAGTK